MEMPHDILEESRICRRCGWTQEELAFFVGGKPCRVPPLRTRVARDFYRLGFDVVEVFRGPRYSPHIRGRGNHRRYGDWAPEVLGEEQVAELVVYAIRMRAQEWLDSDKAQSLLAFVRTGALDRLPILADVLEESGCADGPLLNALRPKNWEPLAVGTSLA